jgi:hypothetical protein
MRTMILAAAAALALLVAGAPAAEWYETAAMRRDDPFMLDGFLHNNVFQSHDDLHDGVSQPAGNFYVQMRRAEYDAVLDAVGHLRQRTTKVLTAAQLARIRDEMRRRADFKIPFLLQLVLAPQTPEVGVVWTLFNGALDSDAAKVPAQQLLALLAQGGKVVELVNAYTDPANHAYFGISGVYQVKVNDETRNYILCSVTYPVKLVP